MYDKYVMKYYMQNDNNTDSFEGRIQIIMLLKNYKSFICFET